MNESEGVEESKREAQFVGPDFFIVMERGLEREGDRVGLADLDLDGTISDCLCARCH
jgi:hypothetical protein